MQVQYGQQMQNKIYYVINLFVAISSILTQVFVKKA